MDAEPAAEPPAGSADPLADLPASAAGGSGAGAGGGADGGRGGAGSGAGGADYPQLHAPKYRARPDFPMQELEVGPTLGTGADGRVVLCYHRKTNRVFALKILKKALIAAHKQQAHIKLERDILFSTDHPFIVTLYATYKDADRLYMLMECVQGGELFSRLQKSPTPGRVTPSAARFYSACVLDALEHLHSTGIVYRALQPEKLLIDSEGYPRLVGFGFAKVVPDGDRTYTLCGTPEYLAPELVLGRGHGKGVDYWALGMLLYEQVAGYSPFADHDNNDQMVICRNILKGEVQFPPHFDVDAALKDLILKLLVKDVPRRLGCMKGGAADVKAHKFFSGGGERCIDWEALRRKAVPAPWRPALSGPFDASHFDEYEEDDELARSMVYATTDWEKDF